MLSPAELYTDPKHHLKLPKTEDILERNIREYISTRSPLSIHQPWHEVEPREDAENTSMINLHLNATSVMLGYMEYTVSPCTRLRNQGM